MTSVKAIASQFVKTRLAARFRHHVGGGADDCGRGRFDRFPGRLLLLFLAHAVIRELPLWRG